MKKKCHAFCTSTILATNYKWSISFCLNLNTKFAPEVKQTMNWLNSLNFTLFREHEKKESGKDNKRDRSFSGDYEEDEDIDRPTKDQEPKQPVIQKDPFDDTPEKESKDDRATTPRYVILRI